MPTKRANGEGSIRKRSDGRWEARYVSPNDGLQRSIYGKTRAEVRQKLTAVMSEVDCGTYIDAKKMKVGEWLDLWLKEFCPDLKETTKGWYRWGCDKHIKPRIGHIRMDKLTKVNVQLMINDMIDNGIAPSTANTIKVVLSSAIQRAVDMDMLRGNPCTGAKVKKEKREKMNIIDKELLPTFIEEAYKTPFGDAITFMLLTGIRAGEMRGLRWSDVDLHEGTITICRQLAYANRAYVIQSTKNGKQRKFPLPEAAAKLLRKYRVSQIEQRMRMGEKWVEDELSTDLVFRMPDGSHYKPRAINNAVKQAGATVGLPGMTPHDLRHTFAVSALRSGMDIKSIQSVLGHSSASITLDVYSHYTSGLSMSAAQKMDAYWQSAFEGG